MTSTTNAYYDPYDIGINTDPYPTFRRLREDAPLFYNEQYDFFAASRYADVEQGLKPYRRDTPLGFALYGELTDKDRKTLAQAIDALAEPLSTVASKVLA